MQQLQLFAWQAAACGNDVHLNANPTQGELLHYEFRQKKEELKDTTKAASLPNMAELSILTRRQKNFVKVRQKITLNIRDLVRSSKVGRK